MPESKWATDCMRKGKKTQSSRKNGSNLELSPEINWKFIEIYFPHNDNIYVELWPITDCSSRWSSFFFSLRLETAILQFQHFNQKQSENGNLHKINFDRAVTAIICVHFMRPAIAYALDLIRGLEKPAKKKPSSFTHTVNDCDLQWSVCVHGMCAVWIFGKLNFHPRSICSHRCLCLHGPWLLLSASNANEITSKFVSDLHTLPFQAETGVCLRSVFMSVSSHGDKQQKRHY